MKDLIISCIQSDLYWEDKSENLRMFEHWFSDIPHESQVIVLPEMFSTGFSMNVERLAEPMNGKTMCWLENQAKKHKKIITGSLIIEEDEKFYNRMIWMQPNGHFHYYDKRHLFAFAGEDKFYSPGKTKTIVQVNGWKIMLAVCYDLRFPVWARQNPNEPEAAYDILLYVANWPQRRITAWDALLKARAIENQAYVIGLNRVGDDGNKIYHDGSSSIIDPSGELIWNLKEKEGIYTHTFSKEPLDAIRQKLPFLKDGDKFIIL